MCDIIGDATNSLRLVAISFSESVAHLLRVAYLKDGNWFYPFANDYRWIHWAQNTVERHRFLKQKSVYISKRPSFSNLSEDELLEIVNANGEESRQLLSSMRAYSGNILGSNAYFLRRRMELEALMVQEGLPTIWFTFSAADNHWTDLFLCLYDGTLPNFDDNNSFNKWKRHVVRENPHLVNAFFHKRFGTLLKHFFGESTFDCSWHWFRVEFQDRGTAHVHGCFCLKNDPGLNMLGMKVAQGRYAAYLLRTANLLEANDDFEAFRTVDDEFNVSSGANKFQDNGLNIDDEGDKLDLYDLTDASVRERYECYVVYVSDYRCIFSYLHIYLFFIYCLLDYMNKLKLG